MYFLTLHGTALCLDADGRVVHRALREIPDIGDLLRLDIAGDTEPARFRRAMTAAHGAQAVVVGDGPLAGYVLHQQPDRRTAAISNNGFYLCAVPGTSALDTDRESIGGWERFLCLSQQDVEDLFFLLHNDWVVEGAVVPGRDIALREPYCLALGPVVADLRYNLPLQAAERSAGSAIFSARLLVDGWKIQPIFLFKPMIFLTAYRSPQYLEQAALCIASLLEFGGYKGAIHVLSDQPAAAFLDAVPQLDAAQLSVQHLDAQDWVGYVASKYCILDHAAAHTRQPLLFLDPDIVADADLTQMLAAIAASDRVMAPMEEFSRLSQTPSVGASLIQRAGLSPRLACGFNCGTLGIPNLRDHGAALRLIRTIIVNHIDLHGRDEFQWVDQEIVNYVAFAAGGFDTHSLLRYVRYGWEGCEFRADQRIGLVHFWPPRGPISKNEAMRTYTRTLREADAR